MEKLRLIVQKSLLLVSFSVVAIFTSQAQMECRSTLGAHLTPFSKNVPILWAVEGTMAPGIMTSPYNSGDKVIISGGMILGALDFTIAKKHNLYFEGGYKNWKNSELVSVYGKSKHFGMRQAFYSFNHQDFNVKLGLHETNIRGFNLLDERIIGASIDKTFGAFTFNVRGGTVMKNFARMGKFCSNRHLYDITNLRYTEALGKAPGETNLFGVSININPAYFSKVESEQNEFSEFSNAIEDNNVFVNNIGFVFYSEFGTIIPDAKMYAGVLVDVNLPFNLVLQTGGIYQNMKQNNTLIIIANLYRNFLWNSGGGTQVSGAFYGKINVDSNAIYQPLSSNLFLGEIMRLDAPDFPLWKAEVKHSFSGKQNFTIALKAVGQITDNNTNEQDLEFSIKLFHKHFKLTSIFSRVQSKVFVYDVYMARLEARLAF